MHIHVKRTTKSHFVIPTQHHSLSSAMMQREGRNYKSEIGTPLFSPPPPPGESEVLGQDEHTAGSLFIA